MENHHDHHNMMDHSKHMAHMMMNVTTQAPHDHANHGTMDMDMTSHQGHTGHDMSGHMMKMYFHFSTNATILFSGWQTTSWETMFGSCIAVFLMAALYEGLKVGREFLLRRTTCSANYDAVPAMANGDVSVRSQTKTVGLRMLSCAHALQTVLHLVQIVVSYFLMLIFMTYNVWLCIAVALGAATGYFLFSWKRAVVIDINEHCH